MRGHARKPWPLAFEFAPPQIPLPNVTFLLKPAMTIGVVAAAMTIAGLVFGRLLGLKFSRVAGIIGGLLLIGLAVKTVG